MVKSIKRFLHWFSLLIAVIATYIYYIMYAREGKKQCRAAPGKVQPCKGSICEMIISVPPLRPPESCDP